MHRSRYPCKLRFHKTPEEVQLVVPRARCTQDVEVGMKRVTCPAYELFGLLRCVFSKRVGNAQHLQRVVLLRNLEHIFTNLDFAAALVVTVGDNLGFAGSQS